MRSFASPFAAAVLAAASLYSTVARSEATEPQVICAAHTDATPAKLIDSCAALIDNPATVDADRLNAMIVQAMARHDNGQTEKALDELDHVIAESPSPAPAFRARGEILRQQRPSVEALGAVNEAIRLEPYNADGYEIRANIFNNTGKYDRAIEDYNEALRLKPHFALAYADRGAAWYFKGEYQKAIADDDQAIKLDPNRAQTYTNRGAAYRKLGNIQRALDDETSAIRIDPSKPEFFDNRGLDLAGNGDYTNAISDYDQAIQIRPQANFLTNRGDAYQAMKNYGRAIADYDAALSLDPKFQRAYNNRGAAWRGKGYRTRAAGLRGSGPPQSVRCYRRRQLQGCFASDRAAERARQSEEPAGLQLRRGQASGRKGDLRRSRTRAVGPRDERCLLEGGRERRERQPPRGAEPDAGAAQVHCRAQCPLRPARL